METMGLNINSVEVNGYTKIANHGMIANNRTAALISMNGTVDWLCLPDFSSNPVFDSILDKNKGGYLTTRPVDTEGMTVTQKYVPKTLILQTTFLKNGKPVLMLTDFLPATPYASINFPEMHRMIQAFDEAIDVKIELKATLDYRLSPVKILLLENGAVYHKNSRKIGIYANTKFRDGDRKIRGNISLKPGQKEWIVISYNMADDDLRNYKSQVRYDETKSYWEDFVSQSTYNGLMKDIALRSALTLRALFYDPTGMMVAAPTSSLPECIGGERNWDYRYSWIRDTSYVIEALSMMGLKFVATNYLYDMMDIIEKKDDMKVLYSIDSKDDLEEYEIDYEGYMNSSPVRMGNLASKQFQLDIYGSMINAIYHLAMIGGTVNAYMWDLVIKIIDKIRHVWRTPDSSIWEFRTPPRHYTYSKVMCWMGYDRAIKIGKLLNFKGDYITWEKEMNEIKSDILQNGVDKETQSFVQYYGSKDVDSSLLRISLTGFLDSNDIRIKSTLNRIEKELMGKDYLMRRYNNDDGFNCKDNAFLLTSFWYAEVLSEQGNVEKAKHVLETLISKGNHLHLFSEEIDMETGEQLGNFPQAITHLGVIRAICKANEKLNGKN